MGRAEKFTEVSIHQFQTSVVLNDPMVMIMSQFTAGSVKEKQVHKYLSK